MHYMTVVSLEKSDEPFFCADGCRLPDRGASSALSSLVGFSEQPAPVSQKKPPDAVHRAAVCWTSVQSGYRL